MAAQSIAPVSITIAETEAAFQDLAGQWNNLSKLCGGSVFSRHEWFDAAWAWRKENSQLFILVACIDNRIVGIFPLITVHSAKQFPKLRNLEFLTVPDTQICDLIVEH